MEPIIQMELQASGGHGFVVRCSRILCMARKRLPTEAEWHLGALGMFDWGTVYGAKNMIAMCSITVKLNLQTSMTPMGSHTSPVGAFSSGQSIYGLEDTFGNAWEFTADAAEPHGNSTTKPMVMLLRHYGPWTEFVCRSTWWRIFLRSRPIRRGTNESSPKYVVNRWIPLCKVLREHVSFIGR